VWGVIIHANIVSQTLQGFFANINSTVGKRINYSREEQTLQGFIANSDITVGKRMN
jgi:polysaccharide pyruvyl transferase WcaK-like protein